MPFFFPPYHLDASADRRTYSRPYLQRYTDRFVTYVDELKLTWDRPEPEHGISLAVRVVRDLRGPSKAGCGRAQEEGGEPAWLQLKWGIALAARAFDVTTAPTSLPVADMVSGLRAYWFAVLVCRRGRVSTYARVYVWEWEGTSVLCEAIHTRPGHEPRKPVSCFVIQK